MPDGITVGIAEILSRSDDPRGVVGISQTSMVRGGSVTGSSPAAHLDGCMVAVAEGATCYDGFDVSGESEGWELSALFGGAGGGSATSPSSISS